MEGNQAAAQEETKEQSWTLKVNRALAVNSNKILMSGGESKEWTTESFSQLVTDKVGEGNRIQKINADRAECNSHAASQMLGVLLSRVSDTGILELTLDEMRGGVTGEDVMPMLDSACIDTLTWLNLEHNPDWWKSGDTFPQLLVLLGRQTNLEELWFAGNDLTTSQTTELLQCVAQSNKKLLWLGVSESCNFDSDESVQALAR